ncbi:YqjF family protein [Kitasatospora sp. NPDC059646]|uniref:YqjF family protein n=1 Tax=Kitasatospora sp. NPDC059646 TaxID=3346893 RepID=UPI0036CDAC90
MTQRHADPPAAPVALRMDWLRLAFLHWPYEPRAVQRLLPAGLTVDEWAGRAWVGLTPFTMADVRLAGRLPLPGPGRFPETNLRTYVRGPDGRDGLWFFSLEAAHPLVVAAARTLLGAPYRLGRLRVEDGGERIDYAGRRAGGGAAYRVRLRPGGAVVPADLEIWLTSRWRAYTRHAGLFWEVPVDHEPWPLRAATCEEATESLTAAAGLPAPAGPPLAHFSDGVRGVRAGPPRALRRKAAPPAAR